MNCENCDKVKVCFISKKVVYDNALLIQESCNNPDSYMNVIKGMKTLLASYCSYFNEGKNEKE